MMLYVYCYGESGDHLQELFSGMSLLNFVTHTSMYIIYYRLQFFWYLLIFLLLTIALVLAAKKPDPRVYNTPLDYFRLICEVILFLVVIVYNGVAEIRQMVV